MGSQNTLTTPGPYGMVHNLFLPGYEPREHVTVLTTMGHCNKIIFVYLNIVNVEIIQ